MTKKKPTVDLAEMEAEHTAFKHSTLVRLRKYASIPTPIAALVIALRFIALLVATHLTLAASGRLGISPAIPICLCVAGFVLGFGLIALFEVGAGDCPEVRGFLAAAVGMPLMLSTVGYAVVCMVTRDTTSMWAFALLACCTKPIDPLWLVVRALYVNKNRHGQGL